MVVRLILCFDGTWNRPDPNPHPADRIETNVVKFYEAVIDGPTPDGATQTKWYDQGVGTNWYDRISGGAFGAGLDQKIQDGYQWLVQNYPDPDPGNIEVYVLGFSRGAYTARSLVGMIRNVGLLRPANIHRAQDAYSLYRERDDPVDSENALAFRAQYSREIRVIFLGVWDTVGALGIPLQALQWLDSAEYAFHDTALSKIVTNAFHALAIDEHRIDFQATLWTDPPDPGQMVEQRWFIGAHGNVGGGDSSHALSDIALAWMTRKAAETGLVLDQAQIPQIAPANAAGEIFDSYGQFLDGLYAKTHPPYYRPMNTTGTNEIKDGSVLQRPNYAPQNPGFSVPGT